MRFAARAVIIKFMKANFTEINTTEQLDALFEQSNAKPVVLFKHSLTCPISAGVHRDISNADADINIVIMQNARNVSDEIAKRTGIRHESPQAIILRNGKVAYHASHYDVTAEDISKFKA